MYDYHTHHLRCGHAEGTLEDYIQSAIQKGLTHVGLSDHSPIYHLGDDPHVRPGIAMSWHELPVYFEEAKALKKKYADRIEVRVGIESDYIQGYEEHFRRLWDQDGIDYVIGSVHWVGDWHIFSRGLPEGKEPEAVLHDYLACIRSAALSGAYQIMGHIDAIKGQELLPKNEFVAAYSETLDAIADAGVAIELNTSGWRKGVAEQYPSQEILAEALARDIPVCLGSDAHAPDLVAADFDRALTLLRDIGYTKLATFTDKELSFVALAEIG